MENDKFTKKKKDIVNFLLSLNDDSDFTVIQNKEDKNKFDVNYNGGYNNIYNYDCTITIGDNPKNIHELFFYWTFIVESDYLTTEFDVDHGGWSSGFMDFFIDEHIRDVGNIIYNQE